MRYTHSLNIIRKRKHTNKISLIITIVLILLIISLGFTKLNAYEFFSGFASSLARVVFAYSISLVAAVVLMLIVTTSEKVEVISIPLLDVLQSFPSFALFPLFVLWFGRTSIVTIIILVVTMIWPILFTLLTAKKQMRTDILEAATAFGAIGWKSLVYVIFPMLFPAIITGSIVAWGEAWEAIIAAEIIVAIPGVGTYLANSGQANHSQVLVIGVFLLLTILFILNKYIWLPLLNMSTKYQQE